MGNGALVRMGLDPWKGSGIQPLMTPHVRSFLEERGYLHLDQIVDPIHTTIWRQGWLSGNTIGLPAEDISEWDRFR